VKNVARTTANVCAKMIVKNSVRTVTNVLTDSSAAIVYQWFHVDEQFVTSAKKCIRGLSVTIVIRQFLEAMPQQFGTKF